MRIEKRERVLLLEILLGEFEGQSTDDFLSHVLRVGVPVLSWPHSRGLIVAKQPGKRVQDGHVAHGLTLVRLGQLFWGEIIKNLGGREFVGLEVS